MKKNAPGTVSQQGRIFEQAWEFNLKIKTPEGMIMDLYGLSNLEILQLIERAFLPDVCRCTLAGDLLSLSLTSYRDPKKSVVLQAVDSQVLNSAREIVGLIADARIQLAGLTAVDVVHVAVSVEVGPRRDP